MLDRAQEIEIIVLGLNDRQPDETDAGLAGRIIDDFARSQPKYQPTLHSLAHDAVGAWVHYFEADERADFWKPLCEAMDALAVETRKPGGRR